MSNSWEYMSFKDIQIMRESREAEGDFIGHPHCYLSEFHKENSLRCLRDLEESRKKELSEEDVIKQSERMGRRAMLRSRT